MTRLPHRVAIFASRDCRQLAHAIEWCTRDPHDEVVVILTDANLQQSDVIHTGQVHGIPSAFIDHTHQNIATIILASLDYYRANMALVLSDYGHPIPRIVRDALQRRVIRATWLPSGVRRLYTPCRN